MFAGSSFLAYSGVDATSPFDVTPSNNSGTSTTATASSLTTTQANDMVIAFYGVQGQSGPSLTVSDDGGGVPATDLPRLFERFYRGDQARTSRGTGLGLAIVKHIVTSAGGEVVATSEPGMGLTVRVSF